MNNKMVVFDAEAIDNNFLFYDCISCCLIRMGKDGKIHRRLRLNRNDYGSYSVCKKEGNYIFFAPGNSSSIIKYDSLNDSLKKINITGDMNSNFFCTKIIKCLGRLIFIPFQNDSPFIVYDCETEQISVYKNYLDELREKYFCKYELLFRTGVISGNKLLLPVFSSNHIAEVSLDDFSIKLTNFGDFGERFVFAADDSNYIYFLTSDVPKLYVFDKGNMRLEEEIILDRDYAELLNMIDCGDYILIPQRESKKSYIFTKKDCQVEKFDLSFGNYNDAAFSFAGTKKINSDEILLILKDTEEPFGIWDIAKKETKWIKMSGRASDDLFLSNSKFFMEKESVGLTNYVDFIAQGGS